MLLAQYIPLGRETIDLDFLATKFTANESELIGAMREISSSSVEDNFTFEFLELTPRTHEHTHYPGFEAAFKAEFVRIRERFCIDIGVGDVVAPVDEPIELLSANNKPLFEDAISLMVYPIESIFAEKVHTIVARGARNSRMKDYYDVYLILMSGKLTGQIDWKDVLKKTFIHRKEELKIPLLSLSDSEVELLQKLWNSFLKGLQKTRKEKVQVPEKIGEVILKINAISQSFIGE